MTLKGNTDVCRSLWLCRSTEENTAPAVSQGFTAEVSCKLVLEKATGEKRAFQEEATATESSIPIPHRFQREPARLIWCRMAVSQQTAELGIKITFPAWTILPLGVWSCLAFIETYLWEHPYWTVSKAQANRLRIGCLSMKLTKIITSCAFLVVKKANTHVRWYWKALLIV